MSARHHTVPQFYLRNFADESGQLVLADRNDPSRTHRTSVRNAVAETGFYRIETEDLARAEDRASFEPESIEAALSALESEMAPAIRTLVEGRYADFTDEQWYRVVQFAAVQSVRGHRWRNDFTAMATQSVRLHVLSEMDESKAAATLAEQGRPSHPAAVQNFLREIASGRFPRILPPQAVLVQESLKMALGNPDGANRGIGEHIANKKPELILPRETAVLTSDEPVVWWRPGDDPVGYASAKVVWVPLSPRLILQFRDVDLDLAAHGLPDPRARGSHDELATFVNRRVAAQAERWVIHRPGDAPLDDVSLPAREVWGTSWSAYARRETSAVSSTSIDGCPAEGRAPVCRSTRYGHVLPACAWSWVQNVDAVAACDSVGRDGVGVQSQHRERFGQPEEFVA